MLYAQKWLKFKNPKSNKKNKQQYIFLNVKAGDRVQKIPRAIIKNKQQYIFLNVKAGDRVQKIPRAIIKNKQQYIFLNVKAGDRVQKIPRAIKRIYNNLFLKVNAWDIDQKKSQSMHFRGATPGSGRYYNKIYKLCQICI